MNINGFLCSPSVPIARSLLTGARVGLFALVLFASTGLAQAQQPPSSPDSSKPPQEPQATKDAPAKDKWVWEVTPYVWATGVGGSIRPSAAGRTVEFQESFSDVLEDLNSAFFLAASARKGRLVLVGDLSFVDLSQYGVVPPDTRARGSLRQVSLTMAVGYRAVAKKKTILDTFVGFRSWLLKPAVESASGGFEASREKSFTDMVVAMRRSIRISDDWSILLYADAGVFRIGSHETRQFVGTISYQASRDFFLSLGYRELSVDYRQNGARVDAELSGPILGATWRF